MGWNPDSNATSASGSYLPERTAEILNDITLYAVWKAAEEVTSSSTKNYYTYFKNQNRWYKIVLSNTSNISITTSSTYAIDPDLYLYESDGATLKDYNKASGHGTLSITSLAAGTYYLKVYNYYSPLEKGGSSDQIYVTFTIANSAYSIDYVSSVTNTQNLPSNTSTTSTSYTISSSVPWVYNREMYGYGVNQTAFSYKIQL